MLSDSLSCSRIKNISQIQIVNIIVLYELEITKKNIYMNYSYKRNGQAVIHIWHTYSTFKRHLKGQCHEIFCFCFFSWIISAQPQSITLRPFQIFSKIHGDISKSRCITSFNTTSGKFAPGVNDTGGKIAKLPPVSTTPAANLPPVPTTPADNFDISFDSVVDNSGKFCHQSESQRLPDSASRRVGFWKFAVGVNNTGGNLPPVSTTQAANFATSRRVSDSPTCRVGELAFESLKEN